MTTILYVRGRKLAVFFAPHSSFVLARAARITPPQSRPALIAQPHLSQFFRNAAFAASKVSVVPLVGSPERGSAYSVIDQN